MYILEATIVVKADDRLALEALQALIIEKIEALAGEHRLDIVFQPILEETKDGKKDA